MSIKIRFLILRTGLMARRTHHRTTYDQPNFASKKLDEAVQQLGNLKTIVMVVSLL
ncbi:MAG: hypothetical protein HXX20_21455 [Chloroflexi bacterium]|nr:hypothetical protein [Chloroflexota bacterium]